LDPEKFWDLVGVLSNKGGYADWEGLASGEELVAKVREAVDVFQGEEYVQVVGDLVLHYAYAALDASDTEYTVEELREIACVVYDMVSTRYWMKSGVVW
jgi:hypothetical protein